MVWDESALAMDRIKWVAYKSMVVGWNSINILAAYNQCITVLKKPNYFKVSCVFFHTRRCHGAPKKPCALLSVLNSQATFCITLPNLSVACLLDYMPEKLCK